MNAIYAAFAATLYGATLVAMLGLATTPVDNRASVAFGSPTVIAVEGPAWFAATDEAAKLRREIS